MKKTGVVLGFCLFASLNGACGSEDAPAQTTLPQGDVQPLAGSTASPMNNVPVGSNGQMPGDSAQMGPGVTGGPAMPNDMPTTQQDTPAAGDDNPAPADNGNMMVADDFADPRGKCDIDSGYPDDEACLLPPAPDEGIQIHIGPKDYKDAAEVAKFVMMPGGESSECWTFHTPNKEPITYQTFVLSGRAGTHHIINTMYSTSLQDGGFSVCSDGGTGTNSAIIDNLPGASKAYMPRGKIAPENAHIGRTIPGNTAAQADMHYFNPTDKPILREFWLNIYFATEDVTEQADQIRGMGGFSWSAIPIAAGSDQVYKYECPIVGNGRILSLLGHYHAHGKQFTASIRRKNGTVEKVFEMFDYLDPAIFTYDSITTNPDFSPGMAGAVSGILEVQDGDTMLWDCHIQNDSTVGLRYTNNVETGEMCNLWGTSLGIEPMNCLLP